MVCILTVPLDSSRKDESQSEDLPPKIDTNFVSTQCFTTTSSDIHTNVDFKCKYSAIYILINSELRYTTQQVRMRYRART